MKANQNFDLDLSPPKIKTALALQTHPESILQVSSYFNKYELTSIVIRSSFGFDNAKITLSLVPKHSTKSVAR